MDTPAAEVAPAVAPVEHQDQVQLDLGLAVVGIAYERILEKTVAIQGEFHLFGTWFGGIVDEPKLIGFGFGARPSFFLTGDAPRGWYVAPFVRLDHVTTSATGASSSWGYSTGGFVGYSWLFADRFNLRLGLGAQWLAYDVHVGARDESFRTFFPAADIVVGYGF